MNSPTEPARDHLAETLVRLYAAKVGRPATQTEVEGIARASADGTTTASVALGYIAGTNLDWPDAHVEVALMVYNLDALPVRGRRAWTRDDSADDVADTPDELR